MNIILAIIAATACSLFIYARFKYRDKYKGFKEFGMYVAMCICYIATMAFHPGIYYAFSTILLAILCSICVYFLRIKGKEKKDTRNLTILSVVTGILSLYEAACLINYLITTFS